MTYVSNSFADFARKIQKIYTIEVHTYNGDVETVEVYARSAESAQNKASDLVGDVDYTVILFAQVIR